MSGMAPLMPLMVWMSSSDSLHCGGEISGEIEHFFGLLSPTTISMVALMPHAAPKPARSLSSQNSPCDSKTPMRPFAGAAGGAPRL